ncbi:unnamed protein product [Didymodactylos carnosus]|uniref:Uncharacterized protein n=1 Tax=Didymodactylos carnosus TaxID=1234261 RepID=A0A815IJ73_9BILA|nr:unnamed protein product [Didymodactylos carnosus]CAF1366672.1 unnamed protein product [Didymodactylos carnosus]CAF3991782.1 unnamed protein product [Didymodactylos carnosus]CAF4249461.1 unnamed protein product [Didymodactylos carnosus]
MTTFLSSSDPMTTVPSVDASSKMIGLLPVSGDDKKQYPQLMLDNTLSDSVLDQIPSLYGVMNLLSQKPATFSSEGVEVLELIR